MYLFKYNGGVMPCADDCYSACIRDYKLTDKGLHITEEEWAACEGIARIVNDEIVLGKSEEEKEREEVLSKIATYRKSLSNTDYVAIKMSEVSDDEEALASLKEEYKEVLQNRKAWREFINANS